MIDPEHLGDEDFELHLIREPRQPVPVPENIRAMRARRTRVAVPTGAPSVQEVLHNPAERSGPPRPSTTTVRRLMRVQLRLAVSLMAWFFGLVVVVNVAFYVSPALAETRIVGIPLQWLFPGVCVIPLLLFLGWLYVRRATANEDQLQQQLASQEAVDQ